MKKILVVNVNWLGDVLFSTPAIKALREKYPDAHIACLVVSRCEEVLKNNHRINEIIVYDEYEKHRSLPAKYRFIRMLRKKKFDTVYVLHQSLKRAMIGFLAGIPNRYGYNTKGRAFLLTYAVPAPEEALHKIDYFLNLLRECGIEAKDRNCEFFTNEDDQKQARSILAKIGINENDPYVMMNPGGNWFLKRWPIDYFAKVSDLLIEQKGLKVIISGSKKDVGLANEMLAKMKNKAAIISGQVSLGQLGVLMRKSQVVVSADSGPMHIASAVGANTVAIFGPTSVELTGPVGAGKTIVLQNDIDCGIPCYKLDCRDNRCMASVSSQQVYDAVCKLLG